MNLDVPDQCSANSVTTLLTNCNGYLWFSWGLQLQALSLRLSLSLRQCLRSASPTLSPTRNASSFCRPPFSSRATVPWSFSGLRSPSRCPEPLPWFLPLPAPSFSSFEIPKAKALAALKYGAPLTSKKSSISHNPSTVRSTLMDGNLSHLNSLLYCLI